MPANLSDYRKAGGLEQAQLTYTSDNGKGGTRFLLSLSRQSIAENLRALMALDPPALPPEGQVEAMVNDLVNRAAWLRGRAAEHAGDG